jgi:Flp pilus assembly protein TadB
MNEHPNQAQQLWQSQPVEGIHMSVEFLRKRSAKFERKIMWRNVREYVASLIATALLGYFFVSAPDALARITFGLFIAALLWISVQLHRKGSAKKMPADLDTLTSLRFYRTELERHREALASVWWWYLAPLVPGLLVYTVGHAIRSPRPSVWAGLALMDAIVAGLFYAIWWMNTRAARCLQRMIDELPVPEIHN